MTQQESLNNSRYAGLRAASTLLLAAVALLGCQSFQDRAMERVAAAALDGGPGDLIAEDSLHVLLCGTGSPLPSDRSGPCTAVLAGGHFFLVDVGPGSTRSLGALQMPLGTLDGVFLTHFHSDHIAELGEIGMQSWALGRPKNLPVYGPEGIEEVTAGFDQAYAFDTKYREAHHGRDWMKHEDRGLVARRVPTPEPGKREPIFDDGRVRVSVFRVDHDPIDPALGYRIEYGGRSVVITGDTKKSDSVVANARGADVLVHEALAAHMIGVARDAARTRGFERRAHIMDDILDYHTTPVEAAEVAGAADVKLLVLNHLVPAPAGDLAESLFLRGVDDAWDGEVVVGEDGLLISLPPGSDEIERRQL